MLKQNSENEYCTKVLLGTGNAYTVRGETTRVSEIPQVLVSVCFWPCGQFLTDVAFIC